MSSSTTSHFTAGNASFEAVASAITVLSEYITVLEEAVQVRAQDGTLTVQEVRELWTAHAKNCPRCLNESTVWAQLGYPAMCS